MNIKTAFDNVDRERKYWLLVGFQQKIYQQRAMMLQAKRSPGLC